MFQVFASQVGTVQPSTGKSIVSTQVPLWQVPLVQGMLNM
jgi:hypothetical protein